MKRFNGDVIRVVVPTVYRSDCPTIQARLLPLCERLVPLGFSFRFLVHDDIDKEIAHGIFCQAYRGYRELVSSILSLTTADADLFYACRPYSITGLLSYLVAKARGIAYALDVDDRTFPSEINKWWRLPLYCQEWMVERLLKSLRPPTSVASQALASYWGTHADYIPNSADTVRFAPGKGDAGFISQNLWLAPPVVIWPAVFFQETDRHYVLEIFAEISRAGKNISLLVLGDGEYLPEVRRRAESLVLDKVHFAGRVPHERMIDYYASAQAGIVPLRNNHYDACKGPIKLYEYMAMGLPVIATDIGEPAATVRKSGCGIVIPFEDAAKAAEMIIDLCSSVTNLKLLGMKGRIYLEKEHSLDLHAELLEGLLRRAVRNKTKGVN
jgi:glycosyltransferase involved in cell wall biosynthesis